MNRNLSLRTLTNGKVTYFFVICLVLMALMTACSEKDDGPTGPGGGGETATKPDMAALTQVTLTLTMPTVAELTNYTSTQITYSDGSLVTAYSLDQFVPKLMIDALTNITNTTESRALFAYRMIGSDGYNPWENSTPYDDLLWSVYNQGYLVPSKDFRSFFEESVGIERGYNVKNLQTLALFRTITVVNPTGTEEVIFELGALPTSIQPNYNGNDEPAIKISDLITTYITTTPEAYEYVFTPADNFAVPPYTWAEVQAGYFSLQLERTTFPTMPDLPNNKRGVRNLMKITLRTPDTITTR